MARARGEIPCSIRFVDVWADSSMCVLCRQAYIVFKSPQAATAAKHKIQSFGEGQQYTKKFTVSFTNPFTNPFRTLPKDGPMRNNNNQINNRSTSGGYGAPASISAPPPQQMNYSMNNSNGGFRGGRGGFNNRGAMNNMPGYNRGGFQGPMVTGFQSAPMGGFQGAPMGGMQQYGGFQPNRAGMMGGMRGGGPMGMRGGRGGISPNGMMGMPMGGMGMAGMGGMGGPMGGMGGMGMGMPQMGGAMGMQGMQGFYNRPATGPASLPGQYMAQAPVTPSPSVASWLPGSAAQYPGTSAFPQATVANAMGYPSQSLSPMPTATLTSPMPSSQNSSLKRTSLRSGQGGFQNGPQAHYNPAFFPQQQNQQVAGGVAGDSAWNPHGAKRPRPE